MNFEITEQSIQFTFGNKKYKSGTVPSRMSLRMRKLMPLKMGGKAIASLQDDSLDDAVFIQRRRIVEAAE